jgi:hypothetical protein
MSCTATKAATDPLTAARTCEMSGPSGSRKFEMVQLGDAGGIASTYAEGTHPVPRGAEEVDR